MKVTAITSSNYQIGLSIPLEYVVLMRVEACVETRAAQIIGNFQCWGCPQGISQ